MGEQFSLSTIHDELKELGLDKSISSKYGDIYGELNVAAEYCGYRSVPGPIWGTWQHGVSIPADNSHPEYIVGADGRSRFNKQRRQLLARLDQKAALESEGYTDVHDIGLPFIYLSRPEASREPNSLLVMPDHTFVDQGNEQSVQGYLAYLERKRQFFNNITICLHGDDFYSGPLRESFENSGFPVIRGAEVGDVSSLARLGYLFSRFETVTGNGASSAFVYAPVFGARVAIAGPRLEKKWMEEMGLPFYRNYPQGLALNLAKNDRWKAYYPFLFCEPELATDCHEWALGVAGGDSKLSPFALDTVLGWRDILSRWERTGRYFAWRLMTTFSKSSASI